MKFLALVMINAENDVLERTLAHNAQFFDEFYVLDGTVPNHESEAICWGHPKCAAYTPDAALPRPPYGELPVDGYRQHLYEQATTDHGSNNWFLILHGDEVWTRHPRDTVGEGHDGYAYPLPVYFPKAGELWDYNRHPLEQLRWHLAPGYPEFRLFRGNPQVRYDHDQHFNVRPVGIHDVGWCPHPIRHYPYRSPDQQRARAQLHEETRFDPDNYRHILHDDAVYWDDHRIQEHQRHPHFRELAGV